MVEFSSEFAVQIATYIGTFGVVYGGLSQRLKELEKKMDRHNHLMEDMATAKADICHLENQCTRFETVIYAKGGKNYDD